MAGWYRIAGLKIRHPRTEDGSSPEVIPPFTIMLFIPLAALWLAVSLVYSFDESLDTTRQILIALFGGVAPILIAYGVMTNRRWTRIAILITIALNIWLFAVQPGAPFLEQVSSNSVLAVLCVIWTCIALYFYRSKSARAYYGRLSGKPLPEELANVDLTPPRSVLFVFEHFGLVSEWVLIILALAIFFGVLLYSNYL